ncbi:MAG: type II toxin-antitoxin system RelE/ParE family toxin [Gammaproteobacteria bacterium]|nr:MAG: type II toxin-antitoxin system RelE/ParE family toxin [Gammaproteobacteria bacterium]RLA39488.1 MAG: type II toxin-antitoxin system RelE/ParE family toxin [Gammaproteobacteria bacterium]
MDEHVVWSPEAVEDLEAIAEFIGRDSAFYASSVVTKVLAVSRSLTEAPLIGRIVPELENNQIRERFIYSYRLIYRIRDDDILVVAIIHGKRLIEGVTDRFG